MADINTGAFSEALNLKADIDLRNIDTNKCDIVIEYQEPDPEDDYKWYRLYASGWVEQGGVSNGRVGTVVLPVEMADTNYTLVCSGVYESRTNTNVAYWSAVSGDRTSTTTITLGQTGGFSTMGWQVSGMADMTTHEILPNPTSNTARALVIQVLEGIYPVGSVYLGTQSVCPMSAFFGTWELVSSGKALWTGDGTNANTTI